MKIDLTKSQIPNPSNRTEMMETENRKQKIARLHTDGTDAGLEGWELAQFWALKAPQHKEPIQAGIARINAAAEMFGFTHRVVAAEAPNGFWTTLEITASK